MTDVMMPDKSIELDHDDSEEDNDVEDDVVEDLEDLEEGQATADEDEEEDDSETEDQPPLKKSKVDKIVVNEDKVNTEQPQGKIAVSSKVRVRTKFAIFCKKRNIPYPNLSARELEHFDDCAACQELWPLYLYQEQYVAKVEYETVLKNWANMRERDRLVLRKNLKRADLQWKKTILKSRAPTGYQIFIKEKRQTNDQLQKIKFGDGTTILAKLWQMLPEENKKVYHDMAEKMKVERQQYLDSLPNFKRKEYDRCRIRLRHINKEKDNGLLKPKNCWIFFLEEKHAKAKESGSVLKYIDLRALAAKEWKETMTEEQKLPYRTRALLEKEKYLLERQKIRDANKGKHPPKNIVQKLKDISQQDLDSSMFRLKNRKPAKKRGRPRKTPLPTDKVSI
jgi:hypothetical protein